MKITKEILEKALPSTARPDQAPDWMKKADSIVQGINEMVKSYQEIAGQNKAQPAAEIVEGELADQKMGFSTARALKKAEMAEKYKKPAELPSGEKVINVSNDLKEILDGIIKSLTQYSTMGYGDKKIGEAILDLPVTVTQALTFLSAFRSKKYG